MMSAFKFFQSHACGIFATSAGAIKSALACAGLAASLAASAQTGPSDRIDEGSLVVDRITYNIEGPKNVSEEAVAAHVRLRKGMKFDQKSLDQSIRSLYNTGIYEVIDATRSVNSNGQMDIDFTIIPKYRISQIVFKGNNEYSGSRLQREIDSYAGSTLSEVDVKRDADKLRDFYHKKGYSLAKATYSIERNDELGVGAVIFDIDEGADIQIQNIRFTGDPNVEEEYGFWGRMGKKLFSKDDPAEINSIKLKGQMKTDTWIWLVSHITDNGRLKEQELQDDLENLRKFYRNHGYLDVEIDESKVKFEFPDEDEPGDMDIIIDIVPNKQYRVGDVTIQGNKYYTEQGMKPFSNETLMRFLDYHDLSKGNVFSPAKIDEMIEDIRTYYGEYGYVETIVRALRRPNVETGDIDLIIDIIESDKYYVESINIQGNTKTKSEVIIRELALAPGDVFDLARMKSSEKRLKNTSFFDEVQLSPEVTNIPNRRNLRIVVKEGRTGNLTFGAGFSTVESLVATVELTQSNFDYKNYHNYFQGAGQKFRLRGTVGLESNQIILSFEEPWVFNRELGYGIDLYRSDTGYYSDYYSEVRLGMTNFLRKRIYELVEARLAYKIEEVDIYDVSSRLTNPPAGEEPVLTKNDVGKHSISQLSLSFLRDNRDNYMMPTEGTRFELIQDIAGGPLMGQTNLYRVEARAGWWIPTFDFGSQVLSFVGRTGSVTGFGGKEVPYYERYFLGGAYNMRGFKYRKVGRISPSTDEPYGGNTFGFISIEYSIEVFNPVRIAAFYDIGFVNRDSWDWDPSDYNSDFGIGFRVLLMGAPMRIDLGFPLKTGDYNSDGMQFNFSFGTVF